jgi:hypothetical protein
MTLHDPSVIPRRSRTLPDRSHSWLLARHAPIKLGTIQLMHVLVLHQLCLLNPAAAYHGKAGQAVTTNGAQDGTTLKAFCDPFASTIDPARQGSVTLVHVSRFTHGFMGKVAWRSAILSTTTVSKKEGKGEATAALARIRAEWMVHFRSMYIAKFQKPVSVLTQATIRTVHPSLSQKLGWLETTDSSRIGVAAPHFAATFHVGIMGLEKFGNLERDYP